MSGVNGEGRGKQSQRLQLACEPCRSAKLKCDRTLPVCEQCYKRSRESSCKYTEKGKRYISVAQKASSMREKIERLELLVSRLKEPQAAEAAPSTEESPDTSTSGREGSEPSTQTGRIKLSKSGSTQWVGPSHWESIIDDIADVKAYIELQEGVENSEADGSNDDVSTVDITLGVPSVLTKMDLLGRMPPKVTIDRFVAGWFNVMDPARIMVHAPTFQQRYQDFWLNPGDVEPAFLGLILAMASLGAETSGQMFGDTSALAQAEFLGRLTAHAFVLADTARPQPHLIEALLLYTISLLYRHHDTTIHVWHIIALTMRLCYQAGYHRDPAGNPNISSFDAEMRRRVWLVACDLDVSVSNTLGMVTSYNRDLCDTAFPSNLLDADFSPDHCGPSRDHEDCTLVQIEISFTKVILVLGDIVHSTHAVRAASLDEVQALHARLIEARNQLPVKLRMIPLDQSLIDSPFEIAERLRIDFACQRALCVLFHRFLGVANHQAEHQACLDAASTIVKNCIAMLEAAQPGGQLAPLRIVFIRHIHDFILGAMLLCVELKRMSGSRAAPTESNTERDLRAKLLRGCQLWNTPGIPSTKAQLALNTIIRFLTGEKSSPPSLDAHGNPAPTTEKLTGASGQFLPAHQTVTSNPLGATVLPTPPEGPEYQFARSGTFGVATDPNNTPGGDLSLPWSWSPGRGTSDIHLDPMQMSSHLGELTPDDLAGWTEFAMD